MIPRNPAARRQRGIQQRGAGAEWIQRLTHAFPKFAWINPEPQGVCGNTARASASSSSSLATACSRCHSGAGRHHAPAVEVALRQRVLPRPRGRSYPTPGACFAGIVRASCRHACALLRHCHRFMISSSSVSASRVFRARRSLIQRRLCGRRCCCNGALVLQGCSVLSPCAGAEPAAAVTTEDQPAFSLEVKAPDSVRDTWSATWNCSAFACCPICKTKNCAACCTPPTPTPANCWARWAISRPPLRLSCARPQRHSRRTPSPSPWSPARRRASRRPTSA